MKSERSFQLGRWLKQLCSSTTCISVMANVQSTLSVFLIYLNAWLTQQAHARKMTARDLNAGADKTPPSQLTGRPADWASRVPPSWGWKSEPAMTLQSKRSGHLRWTRRAVPQMRSYPHAGALVLACGGCPGGLERGGSVSAGSWSVLWKCNYIKSM